MAQLVGNKHDDLANRRQSVPSRKSSPIDRADRATQSATPLDAVSVSLRQAYESTLQEQIPDSFMDLLNKLN